MMKYVIIGAGSAGVRAAETLRDQAPEASITLVSGEPGEPYSRMAIPYILNGAIDEDGARQRRSHQHLASLGIGYMNARALQVHPTATGGQVDIDNGARLDYDQLLVATGSSPSLPPIAGTDLPGVVTCWTLDDARQIAAKLKPGARVIMLGAGFVAGVCMKSLVNSGVKLSVVAGRSGQILRSMMTPVGSSMLQRWLEARGVEVITSGRTLGIEPGPRLVMDTRTIDADLIILATGVEPNVDFLKARMLKSAVVWWWMSTCAPQCRTSTRRAMWHRGAIFLPASGWCMRCNPPPLSTAGWRHSTCWGKRWLTVAA
jgi:NADPH-dependent 2,4-dienoyl-CoA reductase/sulfur reductase-like enzyme